MKTTLKTRVIMSGLILASCTMILTQCTSKPEWQQKNDELIKQYGLTGRTIEKVPNTKIASNLKDGQVASLESLGSTSLYPGVNANLYWDNGAMAGILTLEPNAQIPEEVLSADRFVFVMEGSIEQLVDGNYVTMISRKREEPDGTHSATPRVDFVYLEKGSKNAVKAGASGAKIFEVYSPVRLDYLQKAGVTKVPSGSVDLTSTLAPNVKANTVYDLYDLQYTEVTPGASSRLVTGKNVQISFLQMLPGATFDRHIHPEQQMMYVTRGGCSEILLDGEQNMEKGSVVLIPGNMVHGANIGPYGCDCIDIFWPARTDYNEKAQAREAAFRSIIPADAKIELVIDGANTKPGLIFTEGPKWMNGKLYFSDMYFDQSWNSDPKKSATVEMNPDGTYRYVTSGKMQTNGLYPYKNGNLIVCDMMGHRVVELTTKGEVVKVLASKYDGKSIDGPNDIITDAKGGIYFTDPQFTADAVKNQPGRAVYYISPDGKITRVIEPNEFAMPNGILLTPDGKTLIVNNCYDDKEGYPVNSNKENFLWAYDVKDDGTLTNLRKFATLYLPENILDRKEKSSSSDGMAIDKMGNVYVGTYVGLQIFNSKGEFIGIVNFPSFPVSVGFGGDDMKTLYVVSYNKVYKIRSNMEGYVNYLK